MSSSSGDSTSNSPLPPKPPPIPPMRPPSGPRGEAACRFGRLRGRRAGLSPCACAGSGCSPRTGCSSLTSTHSPVSGSYWNERAPIPVISDSSRPPNGSISNGEAPSNGSEPPSAARRACSSAASNARRRRRAALEINVTTTSSMNSRKSNVSTAPDLPSPSRNTTGLLRVSRATRAPGRTPSARRGAQG